MTTGTRTPTYRFWRGLVLAAWVPLAAPLVAPAHAQWKPERAVEVVAFAAPGGGNDKSARMMQKIWQETKMLEAVVTNKAGKMRILALSTAQRSPGLPDVPTFREQGFDVVIEGWTVFMGPKGLTPAQVAFWESVFEKTVQHPEWKKYLEFNSWEWGYKNARETLDYLKTDYERSKALLTELGMAKQ